MAKQRILPLFILDLDRSHGLGECDFIYCSDKDNGFVARVDILDENQYKDLEPNNIDSKLIVNETTKVAAYFSIVRLTGVNPNDTQLRALLKKASELYVQRTQKEVDYDSLTVSDYKAFLNVLLKQGNEQLANVGSDYNTRKNLVYSTELIKSLIEYLSK